MTLTCKKNMTNELKNMKKIKLNWFQTKTETENRKRWRISGAVRGLLRVNPLIQRDKAKKGYV